MIGWLLGVLVGLAVDAAAPRLALARAPVCPGMPVGPAARTPGATAPGATVPALVIDLAVHRADGVSARDATAIVAAAQAFWEPLGVRLAPRWAEARAPFGELFLEGAGDTAASRAFVAFLARADDRARAAVDLVIVPRLMAPGAPIAAALGALDGLTLVAGTELARALGLPAAFTPTIALGLDGWRRRRPDDLDLLAAHELGHALGLGHGDASGDLMTPGAHRCRPWVDRGHVVAPSARAAVSP